MAAEACSGSMTVAAGGLEVAGSLGVPAWRQVAAVAGSLATKG